MCGYIYNLKSIWLFVVKNTVHRVQSNLPKEAPQNVKTSCEVVVHKRWSLGGIESQGVSFEMGSRHIYFFGENLLPASFKLPIRVVPCCHGKVFVYSEWRGSYSEQRDHAMRQVVAYRSLKTIEKYSAVRPKSCHGRI